MAPLIPTVFEPVNLLAFVQFMLDQHAQSATLIVCSNRQAFIEQLVSATAQDSNDQSSEQHPNNLADPDTAANQEASSKQSSTNPWSIPTLRLLASSRTIKLVFCPDVTHLRAYLATYAQRLPKAEKFATAADQPIEAIPTLAILNPIQLHKPTSAFSAQGLNRTLAVAVEAAHRAKHQLALAECATVVENATNERVESAVDDDTDDANHALTGTSPWDEEVSILNVTTKTFGAGDRGWVGRTVKIRSIAGRWCEFRALPSK